MPCADGAGVIEAIGPRDEDDGPSHGHKVGDRVVIYPCISCRDCPACARGDSQLCRRFGLRGEAFDGCARDHIVVDGFDALAQPEKLSDIEAAAMPTTFITAWHMLRARAQLQPGEAVLVHGGRSGVGSAAIQIARVLGARVMATVRRQEDEVLAREIGADEVIFSTDPDWPKRVRAWNPGGVDVVFEHIGAATWDGSIRTLQRGGRLVTCGATTGHEVTVNLRKLFFHGLSLLGSTMGTRAELAEVLELAGQGRIRPIIGAVRPLADGAAALELLAERGVFGKVVLNLTD